jgi:trigger factor
MTNHIHRQESVGEDVSQLQLDKLTKSGLLYTCPFFICRKKFEEVSKDHILKSGKNLRVPGFRTGKLPFHILDREIGQKERVRVFEQMIQKLYQKLLDEKKIEVLGRANYTLDDPKTLQKFHEEGGRDILGTLSFNEKPTVPSVDFAKITIPHYATEVTPQAVDKRLEEIASQHQGSVPLKADRPAEKGDTIFYTMHYAWKKNGQEKQKDQKGQFVLGSGMFPEEFEGNILGSSKGRTFAEKFTVPENFPDQELAKQKVKFLIKFEDIQETVPMVVGEKLAKKVGRRFP